MPKIKIKVDRKGNATVLDVDGAGKNCIAATAQLEKLLGQAAENQRILTESYYNEELPPMEHTAEGEA